MNYIVSKERLLELLKAENELNVLEGDGVDNWTWYMEAADSILKKVLKCMALILMKMKILILKI